MTATEPQVTSSAKPQHYQLLGGLHLAKDENGNERCYRPGDLVPSTVDLAAKWPEKFGRLAPGATLPSEMEPQAGESPEAYKKRVNEIVARKAAEIGSPTVKSQNSKPMTITDDVLNAMKESELKSFAAENGIGLEGARNKAEIIKTIKAGLAPLDV